MTQQKTWQERFDEEFCILLFTSEKCDKCNETHIVKKNIGLLNKSAQERLNFIEPRKPILDEELITADKVKSFIAQILEEEIAKYQTNYEQKHIASAVEEERKRIKKSFIDYFFESGERWYNYSFDNEVQKQEVLRMIEEEWGEIISLIKNNENKR